MDWQGNPVHVNGEMAENFTPSATVSDVASGEALGDVVELFLKDSQHFSSGKLHKDSD